MPFNPYSTIMKFIIFCLLLIHGLTAICQTPEQTEGLIDVEGGQIWYKVVGSGEGTPLLVIHGGPGGRSCYMIPGYSALTDERPVIFYDQLGSGNSDRPGDTALWELPRFVDEIDSLRKALNLTELHILGSSWGGSVLVEYMITKNPEGVKSVIFSGPLISTPVWMEDAKILLAQLPQYLQDTIHKYETLEMFKEPAFLAATDSFYSRFMRRNHAPLPQFPDCANSKGFYEEIYNYMWGPTEFNATGTLKNFDRTADLHKISQPVLFMAGRYDEARPESMYKFQKLSVNARVVIIENSGHASIFDQPEVVMNNIRSFLKEVEKGVKPHL